MSLSEKFFERIKENWQDMTALQKVKWFICLVSSLPFLITLPLLPFAPIIDPILKNAKEAEEKAAKEADRKEREQIKKSFARITDQTKKAVLTRGRFVILEPIGRIESLNDYLEKGREVEIVGHDKYGWALIRFQKGLYDPVSGKVKQEWRNTKIDPVELTPAEDDPTHPSYKKPEQAKPLLQTQQRFEQRRLSRMPQNADRNRLAVMARRGAKAGLRIA